MSSGASATRARSSLKNSTTIKRTRRKTRTLRPAPIAKVCSRNFRYNWKPAGKRLCHHEFIHCAAHRCGSKVLDRSQHLFDVSMEHAVKIVVALFFNLLIACGLTAADRWNLLIITTDDMSADSVGAF